MSHHPTTSLSQLCSSFYRVPWKQFSVAVCATFSFFCIWLSCLILQWFFSELSRDTIQRPSLRSLQYHFSTKINVYMQVFQCE